MRSEFQARNIRLAIENHDRFSCRVLTKIVRALGGDWAGICSDTTNSLGALEGPQLVVEKLGPLTINLHLKDFTIFRGSHKWVLRLKDDRLARGDWTSPGFWQN
jgi:sugar phosphate isomerase/epimerase